MRYTLSVLLLFLACLTGCDNKKTIAPDKVPPQLPPGTRPGVGESPGKPGSTAPPVEAK